MTQLFEQMQLKTRYLMACFFAFIFLATAQVALAAPKCGSFNSTTQAGSCDNGVASMTEWNAQQRRWEWDCVGGGESVLCYSIACGNGVVDSGEECDGTAFPGDVNQCNSLPSYSSGTMTCTAACKRDLSACVKTDVCGDNVLTANEPCDLVNGVYQYHLDNYGGPTGVTSQANATCAAIGQGTGVLGCYPPGNSKECSPITDSCAYCGNNRIDGTEECDLTAMNGFTCNSFTYYDPIQRRSMSLFYGGTLSCKSDCTFDRTKCEGGLARCGNGRVDEGEECDGVEFDGKTCYTEGCGYTATPLQCNASCQIVRDPNDNFPVGCKRPCTNIIDPDVCTNSMFSDWANWPISNPFNVPCGGSCGPLDDSFVSGKPSGNLCSAFGRTSSDAEPTVTEVKKKFNGVETGQIQKWTWTCGTETCNAYPRPTCRADLGKQSDKPCDPEAKNSLFTTDAAYEQVLNARNKNYAPGVTRSDYNYCDAGIFSRKIFGYDLPTHNGQDINIGVCAIGADNESPKTGWNSDYNFAWMCTNDFVGKDGVVQQDKVYCAAGWGDTPTCGTKNNTVYSGLYDDEGNLLITEGASPFYQLAKSPANPDLCGPNSVPVITGYKKEATRTLFQWKCIWEKDLPNYAAGNTTRYGASVNCQAEISGSVASYVVYGICGNDAFRKFPQSPSPEKPGNDLCQFGKPTSFFFDEQKHLWTWKCEGYDGRNTVNLSETVNCSAEMAVVCGPAKGGGFLTKQQVMAAGACTKGLLYANDVFSTDDGWWWICEDSQNPEVNVLCEASKCGSLDNQIISDKLMSEYQNEEGYLCAAGGQVQGFAEKTDKSGWNWSCTYSETSPVGSEPISCSAVKPKCSDVKDKYYSDAEFGLMSEYWSDNLCTYGNIYGPSDIINVWKDAQGEEYDAYIGWHWGCYGLTLPSKSNPGTNITSVDGNCTALRYMCGSRGEYYTEDGFNNRSNEFLCDDGTAAVNRTVNKTDKTVHWDCAKKTDGSIVLSGCEANLTYDCGTAGLSGIYAKSTMMNNVGVDNGFLCDTGSVVATGLGPKTITLADGSLGWEWYCDISGAKTKCQSKRIDCDPAPSTNPSFATLSFFSRRCDAQGLKLCNLDCIYPDSSSNSGISFDRYLALAYPPYNFTSRSGNLFNDSLNRWEWRCRDTRGGVSDMCYAEHR